MKTQSEILKESGVSLSTFCEYKQMGLVPRISKGESYPDNVVARIKTVEALKSKGYDLEQIKRIFEGKLIIPGFCNFLANSFHE